MFMFIAVVYGSWRVAHAFDGPEWVQGACKSAHAGVPGDDDAGEAGAEARRVVGEMDFFKTEKRKEEAAGRSHSAAGAPDDLSINKDDLTINVRR